MATRRNEQLISYLNSLHKKYQELTELLSNPDVVQSPGRFREYSTDLARIRPLEEKYQIFSRKLTELQEAEEMMQTSEDEDIQNLAEAEIASLEADLHSLEEEIKLLMVTDEVENNRNVFLEIRAGAGGNEASLFAADLLRMYTRIAERKNWKAAVVSTNYSTIGGIKEIVLNIRGTRVFRYLKFESGVHRVQRVPITESSGRIHTSTVTVAVMPEVDDVEVSINAKDIRIDTYRASGCGGQHVNKTESAIRITHFPSGIVVSCQDESSQHKNKEKAMRVLKARLYEHEQQNREQEMASNRKSQVGTGERSEKIRTYNFPQSRVTDHRVSGRNFNIETILDGNFDNLISELTDYHNRRALDEKLREIIA